MKIEIEILSPVHIGSGEEITPIEYVCFNSRTKTISSRFEGDQFIRIDVDKLFKDKRFILKLGEFIENSKREKRIAKLLPWDMLRKYPKYIIKIPYVKKQPNQNNVKEFIKTYGRVFIPGSSLKGAMLSGLIYNEAIKRRIKDKEELERIFETTIGNLSIVGENQFARYLDVTDTQPKFPEDVLEISFINIKKKNNSIQQVIIFEILKPSVKFTCEMRTSIDGFYKFGIVSEKEILKMVDKFYRKVYEKEKNSSFNPTMPKIPENGYLLRIGQGSGVLSTSYLLIAEEFGIRNYAIQRLPKFLSPLIPGKYPDSKKLTQDNIPLGWVIVRPIEP